jgi:pilus assembly protein CpaF
MQGVASGVMEVAITDKSGGTRIEQFVDGEVTIGRVSGNDIVLPADNISKRHTRLVLRDGKVLVVCLKSTNGTYVNGSRVSAPQVIVANDTVNIGDFTLRVSAVVPPATPATPAT